MLPLSFCFSAFPFVFFLLFVTPRFLAFVLLYFFALLPVFSDFFASFSRIPPFSMKFALEEHECEREKNRNTKTQPIQEEKNKQQQQDHQNYLTSSDPHQASTLYCMGFLHILRFSGGQRFDPGLAVLSSIIFAGILPASSDIPLGILSGITSDIQDSFYLA